MRRLWLPVVVGALAYAAGTQIERYRGARELNAALRSSIACYEQLEEAERTVALVEPILEKLGHRAKDWLKTPVKELR